MLGLIRRVFEAGAPSPMVAASKAKCAMFLDEVQDIADRARRRRRHFRKCLTTTMFTPAYTAMDTVSVYLAYGHWDAALESIRKALSEPDALAMLKNLASPEAYLRDLLSRMEDTEAVHQAYS